MEKPDIFNYVTEEVFNKTCKELKDGDSKIIYETEEMKIKLKKRGRRISKLFFVYGDMPFTDCLKDLAMIQG